MIKVFDLHNHHPVAVDGIGTLRRALGSNQAADRHRRRRNDDRNHGFDLQPDRALLRSAVSDEIQRRHAWSSTTSAASGSIPTICSTAGSSRWKARIDYLTLHTGKKIEVPFEQLLIFATNLDPSDLVDDAFLRRMGYRLYVNPPDKEMYTRIFQQYVEANGLITTPSISIMFIVSTTLTNARFELANRAT